MPERLQSLVSLSFEHPSPCRLFLLLPLALLLVACGTKTARPPASETSESGNTAGEIAATKSREQVSRSLFYERLSRTDVVFVGEQHGNSGSHEVQRKIIKRLHRSDTSLSIGLELFRANQQKLLNRWQQNELQERAFRSKLAETASNEQILDYYRPILLFARNHDIPLRALKPTREAVNHLRNRGKHGSSDNTDTQTTQSRPLSPQELYLQETFKNHVPTGRGFYTYVAIQQFWENQMAKRIHSFLSSQKQPSQMVVLTGNLHVIYDFGIPNKLTAQGSYTQRTVLTMPAGQSIREILELPDSINPDWVEPADYIWWITNSNEP